MIKIKTICVNKVCTSVLFCAVLCVVLCAEVCLFLCSLCCILYSVLCAAYCVLCLVCVRSVCVLCAFCVYLCMYVRMCMCVCVCVYVREDWLANNQSDTPLYGYLCGYRVRIIKAKKTQPLIKLK